MSKPTGAIEFCSTSVDQNGSTKIAQNKVVSLHTFAKGFNISIVVDEQPLQVFTPRSFEKEGCEHIEGYIVAQPGKTYKIKFEVNLATLVTKEWPHIGLYVKVDGQRISEYAIHKNVSCELLGPRIDLDFVRTLCLHNLHLVESTGLAENTIKSIGTIEVQLMRTSFNGISGCPSPIAAPTMIDTIPETTKKGLLSVGTRLGDTISMKHSRMWLRRDPSPSPPFAVLTFRYARGAVLKAQGIIPSESVVSRPACDIMNDSIERKWATDDFHPDQIVNSIEESNEERQLALLREKKIKLTEREHRVSRQADLDHEQIRVEQETLATEEARLNAMSPRKRRQSPSVQEEEDHKDRAQMHAAMVAFRQELLAAKALDDSVIDLCSDDEIQ